MRWFPWVLLLLVSGCGASHSADAGTLSDTGTPDAGPDAVDAGGALPEPPRLIAVTSDATEASFHVVELDGRSRRVATLPLGEREAPRWLSTGPIGTHGLLRTTIIREEPEGPSFSERSYLIEWATGRSIDVLEQVSLVDDGLCERSRSSGLQPVRFRWRPDEGAALVECTIWREGIASRVESGVYQVTLDGTATRIASGCTSIVLMTSDGQAVVATGPTCEATVDRLVDLRDGSIVPIPLAAGEFVHFWQTAPAGYIVSMVDTVGRELRYRNLRWFAFDGTDSTPLEASLPAGSVLMRMSADGAILVARRTTGVLEEVSIREPSGTWVRTDVPLCSAADGLPRSVRWAPDSSAFTIACIEGKWIVGRTGRIVSIPEIDRFGFGLSWSPDSSTILWLTGNEPSGGDAHWTLVDPATGESTRLGTLDELDPDRVRWMRQPWTPDCGDLVFCG